MRLGLLSCPRLITAPPCLMASPRKTSPAYSFSRTSAPDSFSENQNIRILLLCFLVCTGFQLLNVSSSALSSMFIRFLLHLHLNTCPPSFTSVILGTLCALLLPLVFPFQDPTSWLVTEHFPSLPLFYGMACLPTFVTLPMSKLSKRT